MLEYIRANSGRKEIDNPDFLLINCGLHDMKTSIENSRRQIDTEIYGHNLEEIIIEARKLSSRPVWIRTTPVDTERHNSQCSGFKRFSEDVPKYNEAADRVMHKMNVPSIDLCSFTLNLSDDLFCDHVHFKEEIRALQGVFIAGWMVNYRLLI
ncbi:MAG: SGNH/GDSL hydrolase family protein [Fibrobacterota bacterium]